jgi:hypothetical protein
MNNRQRSAKGTHTASVAATGADGGDGVGLQRLYAVGPVLLYVVTDAQLPVLHRSSLERFHDSTARGLLLLTLRLPEARSFARLRGQNSLLCGARNMDQ